MSGPQRIVVVIVFVVEPTGWKEQQIENPPGEEPTTGPKGPRAERLEGLHLRFKGLDAR